MLSVVSKTKILNVSNGDIVVPRRLVRVAMFAARGKISGEGIGWFAAKRGEGSDGRARGIEARRRVGADVSNVAVKIADAWMRRPLSFAISKITDDPHINCIFAPSYLRMLSYGASQGLKI